MSLKPKTYPILVEAVENGVKYGYHRAHKHNDNPDQEQIIDDVITAVLHEIFEWFEFDDPDDVLKMNMNTGRLDTYHPPEYDY